MTIAARLGATPLLLEAAAVARLMPMHLRLDAQGRLCSAGPTLVKILGQTRLFGQPAGQLFELRRPTAPATMAALSARIGARLYLAPKSDPGLVLRGLAIAAEDGGLLINLSFGIWVNDAVRRYALTVADFAPTDLTVEMLYLLEAKAAVMAELRSLNLRLHGAKMAAEEQALTDTLTGLRNRRALDLCMKDLLGRGESFGLMHMDLDFFKAVNDNLGHAAGDHVLRQVAAILAEETRKTDLAARVGGDEFVMVFPGLADEFRLGHIAQRIIGRLAPPIDFEGAACRVSASIGMTASTLYETPDAEQMHADADDALYASKRAGRARATMHRPLAGKE